MNAASTARPIARTQELSPRERWARQAQVHLRSVKRAKIAAEEWPANALYRPIPHPAFLVDGKGAFEGRFDILSQSEKAVYNLLEDLGYRRVLLADAEGRFDKALNALIVRASLGDLAGTLRWRNDRVSRILKSLRQKLCVSPWKESEKKEAEPRKRGETKGNREKTVYILPRYDVVKERLKREESIYKDEHGYVWYEGRARRLMSPVGAQDWAMETAVPPISDQVKQEPKEKPKLPPAPETRPVSVGVVGGLGAASALASVLTHLPLPEIGLALRPEEPAKEPISDELLDALKAIIGIADEYNMSIIRTIRREARKFDVELTDSDLRTLYQDAHTAGGRLQRQGSWYRTTVINKLERFCREKKRNEARQREAHEREYAKELEYAKVCAIEARDNPHDEGKQKEMAWYEANRKDLWFLIADIYAGRSG